MRPTTKTGDGGGRRKIRRILTADLQVCRLLVLSDGAARCAEVLTRIRVLGVLQGEGRDASVTPHHHISIQTLEESRYFG